MAYIQYNPPAAVGSTPADAVQKPKPVPVVSGKQTNGEALRGVMNELVSAGMMVNQTTDHVPNGISGSRQNNSALFNLLTELAAMGLIINNTTP